MKPLAPLALAAALALTLAPDDAHAAEPKALKTRIDAVTVYADRAQVARVGAVELPSGGGAVVIEGLPAWIDDDSVRVSLDPPSAGRILDVAVERRFLAESSEEAVRAASLKVQETEDQLAAITDEEKVIAAEIAQLEAVRAFSLDKLPRDMATRDVPVRSFSQTIDYVTEALRKNRAALRELAQRRRTLAPEHQARIRTRDELRSRAQLEQRAVIVQLDGRGRATLRLSYLTPGATWEPTGELRASRGGRDVTLTQFASIVQTTGEDWEGAHLAFSTQRPTDTLAVPEVQALLLDDGGEGLGALLGNMGESFERAEATYQTQSTIANRGSAAMQQNFARQATIQARANAAFAALAERGTTAHFRASAKQTVRGDGRPVRVPIASTALQADHQLVAVPVVSLNAVHTAKLVNEGAQPILPGRLALFVDGAFVGHTESPFVAQGEAFSVYLGVHERVKLSRELDRKRSKLQTGKRRNTLTVSVVISAENLGDQPVTLELGDRVPVAGVDDIEISGVRLPDKATRAADGVVRWAATLPPGSTTRWRVEFELEYPSDLLTRGAAPAGAPAPKRALFRDIQRFEEALQ